MKLLEIEIENFGIFTGTTSTTILLGGQFSTIIGQNGSGKSTLIKLVALIFDRKLRKNGVSREWIPNPELPTHIKYKFDSRGFEKISVALPIEENNEITINISLKLNEETFFYEPEISIGAIENIKFSNTSKLPFDDFVNFIFIDHHFINNFYNEKWIDKELADNKILINIKEHLDSANKHISNIEKVKKFQDIVNKKLGTIFGENNLESKLSSNISTNRIGKALGFSPAIDNEKIETHGSGFEKIFSIISNIESKMDKNKMKIIVVDELENNLFFSYQSKIIEYLSSMEDLAQLIVVTHSPNVVKISKGTSLTKMRVNEAPSSFSLSPTEQYDYFQKDLNTAVFYENVLIVEGHSEKLFYEYLIQENEFIKKGIGGEDIFVMNIQGVNFEPSIKLLKNITKNMFILTDNDMWRNKKSESKKYQGLKRVCKLINILDNKSCDEMKLCKKNSSGETCEACCVGESWVESSICDDGIKSIIEKGKSMNIYTQQNCGDSFEEELKNDGLIDDDQMKSLKNRKLKNLARMMPEIKLKITEEVIKNSKYIFAWINILNKNTEIQQIEELSNEQQ